MWKRNNTFSWICHLVSFIMVRERSKVAANTVSERERGIEKGKELDALEAGSEIRKKDDWIRLNKVSDSQPSGTCTVPYVMKIITFELSKKGRFDIFSGVRSKGACGLYTPEPKATCLTGPQNLASINESRFIHSPTVTLFHFLFLLRSTAAAGELIKFQKHWVHPSRKCAANTLAGRVWWWWNRHPALWEVISRSRDGHAWGLLVIQESSLQCWGANTWLMDILKFNLHDGSHGCLSGC